MDIELNVPTTSTREDVAQAKARELDGTSCYSPFGCTLA